MFYLKTILTTGAAISLWIIFVGFGALSGWWNRPIAPTGDTQQFMDAAVAIVDEESRGNVALVLIRDGELFAEHYAGLEDEVDRNTMFQTASMSKWNSSKHADESAHAPQTLMHINATSAP